MRRPLKTLLIVFGSAIVLGCQYFTTDGQITYGLNHYEMHLYAQAVPPLTTAADDLERAHPTDPRLSVVLLALADMAQVQRRTDLADSFYKRALKAAQTSIPSDNGKLRNVLVPMGLFLREQARLAEAVPLLAQAVEISVHLDDQILHAIDLDNLSMATCEHGDPSAAVGLSKQALEVLDSVPPSGYEKKTRSIVLYNLAYALIQQGHDADAAAQLSASLRLVDSGAATDVEPWRAKVIHDKYAEVQGRLASSSPRRGGTASDNVPHRK